jgi:dipeptidase D
MSALDNMCATVRSVFQLAGAEVDTGEGYPAWKMNPNSRLTKIVVDTYKESYWKKLALNGKVIGIFIPIL